MDRNYPSSNDILANRQKAKDRATYLGAIDHPDNTTVRSAVGLLVGVVWVIGGDNGWHRYPGRRVREAVRLFIAWTTIAHPPTPFSQTANEPRTA
jgi:hypothetical protein